MSQSSAPSSPPSSPSWQSIGAHRYYIHDDVLFFVANGLLDRSGTAAMLDQIALLQEQRGRAFLIIDASAALPSPAESRQYALTWHREHSTRGCAVIFGANILVRAAIHLVNAATRLIARRNIVTEIFVATEADAWAAVNAEREKVLADPTYGRPTPL